MKNDFDKLIETKIQLAIVYEALPIRNSNEFHGCLKVVKNVYLVSHLMPMESSKMLSPLQITSNSLIK